MSLATGSRLGAYEIVAVLGAGGMGEVYRARDTRLGREVAIKIVLDAFAADPDRIARFQREAKVLASLNHPHIAALYGVEEAGGQQFLVMELVEGRTLADWLLRGPLPVAEAVAIATQIADALEAAHEKGVVHRDLKPANVKITPDDRVKVLDFGLAKAGVAEAATASAANSPTLSMMASQAGIILGTAAYMSPEQAKGFPADHRSDVFSFGSVLFEMLSGRQPFQGDTAPEILASVLVREPEFTRLPSDVDPRLVTLVRRCLEKQPKRRWQAIGDVRAELEAIAAVPRPLAGGIGEGASRRWTRVLPAALAALCAGTITGLAAWMLKPAPPLPVARFAVLLPPDQRFTTPGRNALALSPDGTTLVYLANTQLYRRPLGDLTGTPIAGSALGQISVPTFSPDGQAIAFFSSIEQALKRIPVAGGIAVTIGPASNPLGMSWTDSGILYAQSGSPPRGIFRVSPNGGAATMLVRIGDGDEAYGPQLLPDGNTILFTFLKAGKAQERWDSAQIVAQTLSTGARTVIVDAGSDARYLAPGYLAYARHGTVYVAPFDRRRLALAGAPVAMIEGVRRAANATTGLADFAVSANGSLAYVPGPVLITPGQFDLVAADMQTGTVVPLGTSGLIETPRISPDGSRVAFSSDAGQDRAVYVYDVAGTTAVRRLTYGGNSRFPVWSADGSRITFASEHDGAAGIFWQTADGTHPGERLTRAAAGEAHVPLSWHGDTLLFDVVAKDATTLWTYARADGRMLPFGGVRSSVPTGAVFSPDGRWVAYAAGERSQPTVFVQPFPATGAKYELPNESGDRPHHPIWSADGKRLFFLSRPNSFAVVSVTTSPAFAFGHRVEVPRWFEAAPPEQQRPYDMRPNGQMLGLRLSGQASVTPTTSTEIDVVLNWFQELRARLAPGG